MARQIAVNNSGERTYLTNHGLPIKVKTLCQMDYTPSAEYREQAGYCDQNGVYHFEINPSLNPAIPFDPKCGSVR